MPRPYTLGRRAAPKADTRARIVSAALEIFENVAWPEPRTWRSLERPTWPLRRFGTTSRTRVVSHGLCSKRCSMSSRSRHGDLRRGGGPGDTVARLAEALAAFYERGEPWWRAYEREPDLITVWGGGVNQYYAGIERLMRMALGDLASDERSVAVVASVIGPPTTLALRSRGLPYEDAVEFSVELALPWLEQRRR